MKVMWLATIRPGMTEPIVREVPSEELIETASGHLQRRPRQPYARKIIGGGASALSQTPAGAIASCMCVLNQTDMERELLGKRDRT